MEGKGPALLLGLFVLGVVTAIGLASAKAGSNKIQKINTSANSSESDVFNSIGNLS